MAATSSKASHHNSPSSPSSPSSLSSNHDDQNQARCCFENWMKLQESDLSDLLQALNMSTADKQDNSREGLMKQLVEKGMSHFEEYVDQRVELARKDASAYFTTAWCSALEMSLLWLGGCRPSMYVRLLYELCGLQFESQLSQFLQGHGHNFDSLGGLSCNQLNRIDDLRRRTIREEEKLSSKIASLQEDIVKQPITGVAAGRNRSYVETNEDVEHAIREHEKLGVGILEEADKLRLNSVRELIQILTPSQAVDFLAASKKLHLYLHRWGQNRDQTHLTN